MWWSAASSLIPMRPRKRCWACPPNCCATMARCRSRWRAPWREGALKHAHARTQRSPSPASPVPAAAQRKSRSGLVYVAVARPEGDVIVREYRFGDIGRDKVRLATVEKALGLLSADSFLVHRQLDAMRGEFVMRDLFQRHASERRDRPRSIATCSRSPKRQRIAAGQLAEDHQRSPGCSRRSCHAGNHRSTDSICPAPMPSVGSLSATPVAQARFQARPTGMMPVTSGEAARAFSKPA